jgi:hypothetical protein
VNALSAEDAEHRELFHRNVSCTKMGGMAGSVAQVNGEHAWVCGCRCVFEGVGLSRQVWVNHGGYGWQCGASH